MDRIEQTRPLSLTFILTFLSFDDRLPPHQRQQLLNSSVLTVRR